LIFLRKVESVYEEKPLLSMDFWIAVPINTTVDTEGPEAEGNCTLKLFDDDELYFHCYTTPGDGFLVIEANYASVDMIGLVLSREFMNISGESGPVPNKQFNFGRFGYHVLINLETRQEEESRMLVQVIPEEVENQATYLAIVLGSDVHIKQETVWELREVIYLSVLVFLGTLEVLARYINRCRSTNDDYKTIDEARPPTGGNYNPPEPVPRKLVRPVPERIQSTEGTHLKTNVVPLPNSVSVQIQGDEPNSVSVHIQGDESVEKLD